MSRAAIKNKMRFTSVFWSYLKALNEGARYIFSTGGTRSSKTHSALQLLYIKASSTANLEIIIGALTVGVLKKNLMNPFIKMIQNYDDKRFNRTDKAYNFPNGSVVYFLSADSEEKFVGLESDYVLLDEANLYAEADAITTQLAMRCRVALIFTQNPSRRLDWIAALEERHNTIIIHSTYKDNQYLEQNVIDEIEERAKRDKRFAAVYRDGRYMADSERAIFNNWETVNAIPEDYKWRAYSADWGFSNDPTAIVEATYSEGILYIRELVYRTGMTTMQIFDELKKLHGEVIWGDNSEPRLIHELNQKGINIVPTKKYPGSVLDGIRALQNQDIRILRTSTNVLQEFEDYQWKKTSGVLLDIPEDKNNHAIDALRYGVVDRLIIGYGKYIYS